MQQISEGFSLSPQQTRLWSLQQQCTTYRAYCMLLIEGELDIVALRRATEAVFLQHEIFRTTFYRLPGMEFPVQVINDRLLYTWRQVSSEADIDQQQEEMDSFLLESQHAPLDVEKGPLIHCSLLSFPDQKHVLYIGAYPLHADVQTLSNLIREVCLHYNNSATTNQSQETEIPQYTQFSEWQNSLLEEDGKAYWSRQNIFPALMPTLPYERQENLSAQFRPLTVHASIEAEFQKSIYALLKRYECSLPVFFFTCWQVLLWRFLNQDELVFGLGVTDRLYDELLDIAGPIAKYIPFLSHPNKQLRFCDFLRKVQEDYDAHGEQQLYFAVDDPTTTLLYPFGFDYYKFSPEVTNGKISFSPHQCSISSEPFKVRLLIQEHAEASLNLTLEYNANLYDIQDIQLLSGQLQHLIKDAVLRPECKLSELEILNVAERDLVLMKYNQTTTPYPQEMLLHLLFERQVAQTPDAIAVVDKDHQLTYQALDTLAHQTAQYLQRLPIGAEDLVGIYLERSVALVIAILGVLKAGAAYVPLDLSAPLPRLRFIASDAQLKIVLTTQQLQSQMTEWPEQTPIVSLESMREQFTSTRELPPLASHYLSTNNLAYVIYTSGSTGKPKGVMISHQGAAHYVQWCSQHYEVASGWGVPVHSPISFDLTVTALFAPLVVGRVAWLLEEGKELDELAEVLRQADQWSLLKLTPAHLNLLNQQLEPHELSESSRALILGGEALKGEHIRRWQQEAPQTRLINEYGPTETVVGCCIYEVTPDEEIKEQVPIGHPIANTRCYVLDERGLPVPIGIVGELYIGGIGLGRGYVGRADLTAERFVPDPYCNIAGARMYRTGDLARYKNQQGILEYLGRVDRQIKLRGYRIELGEIEKLLERHEKIRECVVEVFEEPDLDKSLVAYVVPNSKTMLEPATLRDYLSDHLPAYMIPESYVILEALPLTTNGKVNRSLLPPPDKSRKVSDEDKAVAPRDMVEFQLLQIWEKTLKVHPILITDNFFDLGGHSILAVSLIAQIRKRLDVNLPLAILFEHKTIAELAAVVRQQLNVIEDQLPADVTAIVPRDVVEFQLQQIWEEVLQVNPILITDSFFELGGNDLLAERVIAAIREQLDINLAPSLLSEHSSIAELAIVVRQRSNALKTPALVTIQAGATTKRPLFCVHPAGGTVFCYTNLARHLGADQPFYGLQTPDLVENGGTYISIEELAALYVREIQRIQPQGPYQVGGWSSGGVMAFEIAQQLSKRHQKVSLLALLDANVPFTVRNPDAQIRELDTSDAAIVMDIMSRKTFSMDEDISMLPPVEQLRAVMEEGKKANLVPADTDLDQFRRLWRIQMMNVHAVRSYIPDVYPGQIDLFRAEESIKLGRGAKKASVLPMTWALTGGWETLTSQEILIHQLPGGHRDMMSEPNVQLVATTLKSRMEQIEAFLIKEGQDDNQ
ncbi:non-ribosomal peptide synthetase [Dictyobacter formicarum]|uniref:Carrier domain-containing protein n=1 Tax=Dictyobacter formicarum TaxID=2778368 RepID=A0ABQ3VM88_9CHLR|nr:non-ribosomal peptide synthetase [Dictyobacter formicarum]GHO86478.1 hypothetical protein KSZ_44840 [Dictyobacter formicarum]